MCAFTDRSRRCVCLSAFTNGQSRCVCVYRQKQEVCVSVFLFTDRRSRFVCVHRQKQEVCVSVFSVHMRTGLSPWALTTQEPDPVLSKESTRYLLRVTLNANSLLQGVTGCFFVSILPRPFLCEIGFSTDVATLVT